MMMDSDLPVSPVCLPQPFVGEDERGPAAGTSEDGCCVYRLGQVPYAQALRLQRQLAELRKRDAVGDSLLLLEHPPVITLGRNAQRGNLLSSPEQLAREGIELAETNRGGDITFHGPGQLVGYPILQLGLIRKDVVWYVRTLEEVLIRTLAEQGVAAYRRAGMTGVWVDQPGAGSAKIAAIGVHISRWVTSHGFALNIDPDLSYYRHIVPCGISAYPVCSLRQLLGDGVDQDGLTESLLRHFGELLARVTGRGEMSKLLELTTASESTEGESCQQLMY